MNPLWSAGRPQAQDEWWQPISLYREKNWTATQQEVGIVAVEDISVEQQDGISVICMNRPPANAFTIGFARQFASEFRSVLETGSKALVVTGSGDFFSGGLDLRLVPSYSVEDQRAFLELVNRMMGALYACPLPVVAAVNGHAIAGAFVLALTADYRIGPRGDSRFGLTEARAGIPFPAVPAVIVRAELSPPQCPIYDPLREEVRPG